MKFEDRWSYWETNREKIHSLVNLPKECIFFEDGGVMPASELIYRIMMGSYHKYLNSPALARNLRVISKMASDQ